METCQTHKLEIIRSPRSHPQKLVTQGNHVSVSVYKTSILIVTCITWEIIVKQAHFLFFFSRWNHIFVSEYSINCFVNLVQEYCILFIAKIVWAWFLVDYGYYFSVFSSTKQLTFVSANFNIFVLIFVVTHFWCFQGGWITWWKLTVETCPSPTFLGNSPLYIVFLWAPPKNSMFQLTPKIWKFFMLKPILSFENN